MNTEIHPFLAAKESFNLRENKTDRISLSWHLTKNEKQKIERAFKSSSNQLSLQKLKNLLNFKILKSLVI